MWFVAAAGLGSGENASELEQLMHRVRETSALPEKRTALTDIKDLIQSNHEVSHNSLIACH